WDTGNLREESVQSGPARPGRCHQAFWRPRSSTIPEKDSYSNGSSCPSSRVPEGPQTVAHCGSGGNCAQCEASSGGAKDAVDRPEVDQTSPRYLAHSAEPQNS